MEKGAIPPGNHTIELTCNKCGSPNFRFMKETTKSKFGERVKVRIVCSICNLEKGFLEHDYFELDNIRF